jgi:membrane protein YdbS with pleckstrin-like domain
MLERIKRTLLRVLRVPPEPQSPAGSPESIRTFRASRNYFRYKLFGWGLKQVGAIIGVIMIWSVHLAYEIGPNTPLASKPEVQKVLAEVRENEVARKVEGVIRWVMEAPWLVWGEIIGLGFVVVQAPVTYALIRLDYEMRWYIVTDRSLRIREGVASVREMTMTFANVQNLSIEQGPIQRLLGISDLRVRTAGGGSSEKSDENEGQDAESMHIGYLRGVDNAQEIRDTILTRLRQVKGAGLGDPEDELVAADAPPTAGDLRSAAAEMLKETRALRRIIERTP